MEEYKAELREGVSASIFATITEEKGEVSGYIPARTFIKILRGIPKEISERLQERVSRNR